MPAKDCLPPANEAPMVLSLRAAAPGVRIAARVDDSPLFQ